ncbi:hypothetical protein GCM10009733_020400 [Nonomuraea maheshkhaliensis]|uniref:Uncharacterized protein n=1 Tax=Nonomuraea maheshkhaliensis TaxID=419590 RepID=A0ABP4QV31_9ACTN
MAGNSRTPAAREPVISKYRVAIMRPYGPAGDALELTPVGNPYDDQARAELAASKVEHTRVIALYLGGKSSADPPGRPAPNQWIMICTAEAWEMPLPTWGCAARTVDRIARIRSVAPHTGS